MKQVTTTFPFTTTPGKGGSPNTIRDNHQSHPSLTTILLLLLCSCFSFTASAIEEIYYYHNDHLGSPVAMSNQSGTVVWRADYQPFGETTTSGSIANTHGYIGKEKDPETGLYYVGARYYDPNTGRFLSQDPSLIIGDGGDLVLKNPQYLNHYPYSLNNPYRFYDPSGRIPLALIGLAIYALWDIGGTVYDAWTLENSVEAYLEGEASGWDVAENGLLLGAGLAVSGPGQSLKLVGNATIGVLDELKDIRTVYIRLTDIAKGVDLGLIKKAPRNETISYAVYDRLVDAQHDMDQLKNFLRGINKPQLDIGLIEVKLPQDVLDSITDGGYYGAYRKLDPGHALDIINMYKTQIIPP